MDETRRAWNDDSGIALAIVMGIIALMVLLATGAFYLSSQTLLETTMAGRHDAAFQAASSGIVVAFTNVRSALTTTMLPTGTVVTGSIASSSAAYTAVATLNAARKAYECTSTGTTPDGTKEVVISTFTITAPGSVWLPYGFDVFYFGGATVGSVNGNGTITGPFFVLYPPPVPPASFPTFQINGNERMSGGPLYIQNGNFSSNKAAATTVNVYTNGTVNGSMVNGVDNGSHFIRWPLEATAALSVTRVDLNSGPSSFLPTSLANATAQSSDNVLGTTTTAVQEVTQVGVPNTYVSQRGPNVVASGPYKVVGSSTAITGLAITNATASFGRISGGLHDDFAYDKASSTLYVEGTVYVWGKLTISKAVSYVGNGTIVCSGDVQIGADVLPKTGGSQPQPDATHLLCVFTAGTATLPTNGVKFTGAVYAVGPVSVPANNLVLQGSFVAEGGLSNAQNSPDMTAIPLIGTYMSPGMPNLVSTSGGAGGSAGLRMTAWRRL
jgi:hypothetical protein